MAFLMVMVLIKKSICETTGYAVNNVAFRRQFLLEYPLSCNLNISLENCTIYARTLRKQGATI